MYQHCVFAASWQQKWGLDVNLEGLSTVGIGKQTSNRVATDPGSILLFTGQEGRGAFGSYETPTSPLEIIKSIELMSMRL
jgi:hypothetical protein